VKIRDMAVILGGKNQGENGGGGEHHMEIIFFVSI